MTKLSEDINKPRIEETLNYIDNLTNNQNILLQEQDKGEPVTPCMDVYKAQIQPDGILDKTKLSILVRGDLHNKELVGDNCS